MAFIPGPPFAVRLVVEQSLMGQQIINVLHYLGDETVTGTLLDDLLAAFKAEWEDLVTGVLGAQNEALSVTTYTATAVTAPGGVQRSLASGATGGGGSAEGPLANMEAVVVTLRTDFAGRSFRGRTYVAGIDSGLLATGDNNHINAATRDYLVEAFDNLLELPTGTPDFNLCVASYYTTDGLTPPSTVPRATAIYTPVTSLTCDGRIDTQRRRRPSA